MVHKFRASKLRNPTDAASILQFADEVGKKLSDRAMGRSQQSVSMSLGPQQLLPSELLVEGVIDRIGESLLASIPSGESETWESVPIAPSAKRLPDVSDLVKEFNDNEIVLSQNPISAKSLNSLSLLGSDPLWHFGVSPLEQLRFRVTSWPSYLDIALEGADATGKVIMKAYFLPRASDKFLTPKDLATRLKEEKIFDPIQLTPEEEKSFDLYETNNPASPILNRELDPVKYEPLAFVAARTMSAISDRDPEACFVADMADGFDAYSAQAVDHNVLDLKVFEAIVREKTSPYERVELPGAVVWRPIDPDAIEHERADRGVLKGFIQKANSQRFVDSHDKGLVLHAGREAVSPLALTWCYSVRNRIFQPIGAEEGATLPTVLFLLGGIGEEDWANLVAGQKFTARSLGIEKDLDRVVQADSGLPIHFTDLKIPEIQRHAADLLSGHEVGDVQVWLEPAHLSLMRFWGDAQKEPARWFPTSIKFLASSEGNCKAVINSLTGKAMVTTDRSSFETSMAKWNYRFSEIDAGVLHLSFPNGGEFRMPLAGVPKVVTTAEKFVDLPSAMKDSLWDAAQKSSIADAIQFKIHD